MEEQQQQQGFGVPAPERAVGLSATTPRPSACGVSVAIPNAVNTYPRIDHEERLLIYGPSDEDAVDFYDVFARLFVAEEALKKQPRDLLGEFDFCRGGDMSDVDQHYPMDDVISSVATARELLEALLRLAGHTEHLGDVSLTWQQACEVFSKEH